MLTNCSTNNNKQQPITSNQQPTTHNNQPTTQTHSNTHQHTHTHTHQHTATQTNADTNKHTTQTHHTNTPHKHQHTHHHQNFRNQLGPDVTGVPGWRLWAFSICRYTQGAFLLPETASAFLSTMFLRIPVPSSVLGLSTSESGLFWHRRRSVTLATLRFCSRSAGALLPSLVSRWLPLRWLRRFAAFGVARPSQGPALMSVFSSCGFRCVALWRCPYCDRKSSRVPSCGFCWLGAFFTALEGCDEDVLASCYDLGSSLLD